MREGGERHSRILHDLVQMVRPGVRAVELENRARHLIKESGDKASFLNYKPHGANRPFPAALCLSINDEVVHGIPNEGDKVLKEGDIVTLDLGLTHGGLVTDAAITVPVGKVSQELERLIHVTREALMAGIKAAKGGRKVSDISIAIERIGRAGGYGIVEDLAGHGVGYGVHEDPFVPNYIDSGNKDVVLKPGMTIAIEPMFNLGSKEVDLAEDGYTFRTVDGQPSAHFEHTVLITKGDAEVLTELRVKK